MPPEMGRTVFRIAFFITLVSAALLPFLSQGTAEFVVDVLALGVGMIFIGIIAFFARWSARG
jgi:hypothetical protein